MNHNSSSCLDIDIFSQDVWWVEVWIGDATKISNREYTITSDMHQSPGDQICFDIVGQGDGDIRPTGTVTIVGRLGLGSVIGLTL